jgi:hypothetical protein
MVYVRRLHWELGEDGNEEHIARHHVTRNEVEQVCHGRHITNEGYKRRLRIIGETVTGRVLTIILAPYGKSGVYYPVTAFDTEGRDLRNYQ